MSDKKVLISFRHGLGDAVQLTIVLKHLIEHRPNWVVDVEALVGKHTIFYDLCNQRFIKGKANKQEYEKVYELRWFESFVHIPYTHVPPTKVTKSIRDELRMEPDASLFHYSVAIQPNSRCLVNDYISKLDRGKGLVVCHFQGNTGARNKNIDEEIMRKIVNFLMKNDFCVIILDWDQRKASRLANNYNVFCPGVNHPLWGGIGTGDGNILAALIDAADLFIGIDSGPLHVAGATKTPSLGLWTNHHPIHYFDLADNVKHLLPCDARKHIQSKLKNEHEEYFHENYQYRYYADLVEATIEEITKKFQLEGYQPKYSGARFGQWWSLDGKLNAKYL